MLQYWLVCLRVDWALSSAREALHVTQLHLRRYQVWMVTLAHLGPYRKNRTHTTEQRLHLQKWREQRHMKRSDRRTSEILQLLLTVRAKCKNGKRYHEVWQPAPQGCVVVQLIMERQRWWTLCWPNPAFSVQMRSMTNALWTLTLLKSSEASQFWPRTRPSPTRTSRLMLSTLQGTQVRVKHSDCGWQCASDWIVIR